MRLPGFCLRDDKLVIWRAKVRQNQIKQQIKQHSTKHFYVMKAITLMSEWLKKRRENSRRNRYIRLNREAFHRIQVMEYDNRLYICFDGMPIAEEKILDCRIEDAVNEARKSWVRYEFR